jgi:hypothetical protein
MAFSRRKSHDAGSEIATIRTAPETNFQGAARVPQFDHPAPRDRFWVRMASAALATSPCMAKSGISQKGHKQSAISSLFDLVMQSDNILPWIDRLGDAFD